MLKIFLFEKLGFFGKYKKLFGWARWMCQLPDDRFVQMDMVILFMKLLMLLLLLLLLLLFVSMQSLLGGNFFYGWARWVVQVIDLLNGREIFFSFENLVFWVWKINFLEEMDPCRWARWVRQTNPFLTTILDHL